MYLRQRSRYGDSLQAGRGSNPGGIEVFVTLTDRPWGSSILLQNGYHLSFPWVSGRGVTLVTHNHLASRLKKEQNHTFPPPPPLPGLHGKLQSGLCVHSTHIARFIGHSDLQVSWCSSVSQGDCFSRKTKHGTIVSLNILLYLSLRWIFRKLEGVVGT